jgi:hypothetical protein
LEEQLPPWAAQNFREAQAPFVFFRSTLGTLWVGFDNNCRTPKTANFDGVDSISLRQAFSTTPSRSYWQIASNNALAFVDDIIGVQESCSASDQLAESRFAGREVRLVF